MDLALIIGAIVIFIYEFFNEGARTREQSEAEQYAIETNRNIARIKQTTKDRYEKQLKK